MGFDGDDDWALSAEGWALILAAADQVLDNYRADLESLRAGTQAFGDTAMFQQLPPLHLARYDAAFAEAFLTATNGVATKLRRAHEEAWPYPTEALLGSVAEELAMEAILVGAELQADLLLDSRALSPSGQAELTLHEGAQAGVGEPSNHVGEADQAGEQRHHTRIPKAQPRSRYAVLY